MPASRPKRPAPPKKKRASKGDEPAETTLDSKKKAIVAEQEKVEAQMEKYRKLIEDAPRLAEERKRRQRDEYVTRASSINSRGLSRTALPDRRYELNAGVVPRQRRLRAERHRGRLLFFVLLLVFAGVVCWVYFTMLKGGW